MAGRRKPSGFEKPSGVEPLPPGDALQSQRVWAPFEPGHTLSVKHGAYSERFRGVRAAELVAWFSAQDGLRHVRDESFKPAVWRWAHRQAFADLLLEALETHQDEASCAGCDSCRGWEERWQRADRGAEKAGQLLGLDPRSRAELLETMARAGLFDRADEAKSLIEAIAEQFGPRDELDQMLEHVAVLRSLLERHGIEAPPLPTPPVVEQADEQAEQV